MTDREFDELCREAADARRRADKAQGALDAARRRLKEEFDCDTVEEAEEMLANLARQERGAAGAFDEAYEEFRNRYGERLS